MYLKDSPATLSYFAAGDTITSQKLLLFKN